MEFSPWHIAILAVVAGILFFGWKQLPDMARSAGRSLRVFRTELKGMTADDAARDAKRAETVPGPAAVAPPTAPPVTPPAAVEDVSVNDGPGTATG